MANSEEIKKLSAVAIDIRGIDRDRLLRPELGTGSLVERFQSTLDVVHERLDFALENAPEIHEQQLGSVTNLFEHIRDQLSQQLEKDDAQFLADRDSFVQQVAAHLENLKMYWMPLVGAALERRGFLKDQGLKEQHQRSVDELRLVAQKAVDDVRTQTNAALEEAKKMAEDIENRARRTAAKISVQEAQEQFREASEELGKAVKTWTVMSLLTIVLFLFVGGLLLFHELPKDLQLYQGLYQTAIRIALLTVVGAMLTFSLRILRAQMHMRQHNYHRRRLANCMGSFVESAVTPEQRDLILAHLVGAIASFGTSGLLASAEDVDGPAKLSIESITRNFGTPNKD